MRPLILVLAGAVLGLTPALLAAQVMPATVIRRGVALELSDGEPISYLLEHAQLLGLNDEQRLTLMNIRRRLRQTNAPFMQQMDSLRESVGLSLAPRERLQSTDREALDRFQRLSKPIVDSIRINNQAALGEARLALGEVQRFKLDSLVKAERDSTSGRGRRPPPR